MTVLQWIGVYFLIGFLGFLALCYGAFRSEKREASRTNWHFVIFVSVFVGVLWPCAVYFWMFGEDPDVEDVGD